jgi:hypothetical protein
MTLIPADTKDAKGPQEPPVVPTTNPFPNPILEPEYNTHDLPPYSETDSSSQTREVPPPPPVERIPESNAVNAPVEVHLSGPIHVLGYGPLFPMILKTYRVRGIDTREQISQVIVQHCPDT